jgi:methylenetetrahydrofolate--tRNA-(uracil-5-)-methyltransferase
MSDPVHIVGGGLAGSECAWQLARRGVPVVLHEMRPVQATPAHKTGDLAELVCSNSLRSDDPLHAAGLLKREMEAFDSLIIAAARTAAVPAGSALAVDRERFAAHVTGALAGHPGIELRREEVTGISAAGPDAGGAGGAGDALDPAGADLVIATGPLTSPAMAAALQRLLGSEYLYFYDAIAPIVEAESLDMSRLFWQSRYGKGGDDYLNAPLDRERYTEFHTALLAAEVLAPREFEQAIFFEGCLPIEELARRGVDTLRYGPMKPVGLRGPDGRRPWAVVQLRQETLARRQFNLVGCQSRMKWGEQQRVLRLIPGLEQATFVRFGQIHRNTFINAPSHLDVFYRVRSAPRVRLAGQITGVEGYLESAATGLAIALYLSLERQGRPAEPLPAATALGSLARHLTESDPRHFQPANVNYGLFPELAEPPPRARSARRSRQSPPAPQTPPGQEPRPAPSSRPSPAGGRGGAQGRRAAFAARAVEELAAWAARQGLPLRREPLAAAADQSVAYRDADPAARVLTCGA